MDPPLEGYQGNVQRSWRNEASDSSAFQISTLRVSCPRLLSTVMNVLTLDFIVKIWGNAGMLDKYVSEQGIEYKFGGGRRNKERKK